LSNRSHGLSCVVSARPSTAGERRTEYELIRLLAESATAAEAAPRVLAWLAGLLGARAAALWFVDDDGAVLRHAESWAEEDPALDELRRVSRRLSFTPGVGLPGRVWQTGEPAWIDDIRADPNFPRVEVALAAGVGSAVALPVTGPSGVLGVTELLLPQPMPASASQVMLLRALGRQLGEDFARVRA